jgi:hypothetical protein
VPAASVACRGAMQPISFYEWQSNRMSSNIYKSITSSRLVTKDLDHAIQQGRSLEIAE